MYATALKRISVQTSSARDHIDVGSDHVDAKASVPSYAGDPLGASGPLPYHHVLFPRGFPVQIKTNDSGIIRAAEQSWASFPQRFREAPLHVRLIVSDSPTRRRPPIPVFRAQMNLFTLVADSQNFACCDLASGFGFVCLTKAAMADRNYLRYHFLEGVVYALLETQHLVTVHAACVVKDGHGVLFVGDSGAGKSSLAYACARRGWIYVSDDGTSLVRRRPGRQVLGNPQHFRFRPSARTLFPELRGRMKLRNGKPTVEVRTETLHIQTACECSIDYVVFLERRAQPDGRARLVPLSEKESLPNLFNNPWPPELPIHQDRLAAVERLLKARLFRLDYLELDAAIDLLEETIQRREP
jgi:hypothetical protein